MSAFHRVALLVSVALMWASYARGLDDWLLPCITVSSFVIASVADSFSYKRDLVKRPEGQS